MKTNRHSISNIKKYQHYIDRVTSNFYFKDNSGTIVFDIDKEGDINVNELITFISQIQTLTTEINDYFGFGEDVSSNSIKLNLQSPGNFAITEKIGKSLAMLAILITLQGCGSSETINSQIPVGSNSKTPDDFIEMYRKELSETQSTADTLNVNRNKIYKSIQLVDNN